MATITHQTIVLVLVILLRACRLEGVSCVRENSFSNSHHLEKATLDQFMCIAAFEGNVYPTRRMRIPQSLDDALVLCSALGSIPAQIVLGITPSCFPTASRLNYQPKASTARPS